MTGSAADSLERIRGDFPVLERRLDGAPIVYLDSASTTLKPRQVINALVDYYSRVGANIHRGKHYLSEEASTLFEEARYKVAQYAGCFGNEVIFVRNTTEALNIAAQGLGLKPTDVVVGVLDAHHSQLLPWRRSANLKLVGVNQDGQVDLAQYEALLRERPRVVALSHASNVTGVYAPLEKMVELAKAAGAVTVVDAAQSIGHRRLNFAKLGLDFLAFSSHKMMGPTGVGVLVARREHLDNMQPQNIGGGTVDWVDLQGYQLRKIPHRHEAGTPDIAGVIGLGAAIDYLMSVGVEAIDRHDAVLAEALREGAMARDYLELVGPKRQADKTAIASVRVKKVKNLTDVARMLSDSYGIMCRTGHHCAQPLVDNFSGGPEVLRASAYAYNTLQEVAAFYKALDEIRGRLGL